MANFEARGLPPCRITRIPVDLIPLFRHDVRNRFSRTFDPMALRHDDIAGFSATALFAAAMTCANDPRETTLKTTTTKTTA
ncbi:hypothetical protein H2509_15140 [Stappia sp. F7233]|uniref:Uncharacterized protein n=1 Tax=Stappia albiluteola TaxID=2758565 RepID=A0A839AHQ6_9HYPH|nr:hypothetical protein [Stappia albiluteola]MBA5778464.1 hypothetical protein [Stappia albiluteola]